MYLRAKNRLHEVLETTEESGRGGKVFCVFIVTLILLNVCAVILETVPSLEEKYQRLFWDFEVFSVAVFSIEYLFRLWTCTSDPKFASPIWGRIGFALTPLALVDLMAVLPFYLPMFLTMDLRFIRVLRFFRLIRLLKLGRYSDALGIMGKVVKSKKEELILTALVSIVVLVFASSLMYLVEKDVQPDKFSSIPAALWWAVATLTTVGYGDVTPVTPLGKIISGLMAVVGIGMFALPTGILGSGFMEEMHKQRQPSICPHCKRDIDGAPESSARNSDR